MKTKEDTVRDFRDYFLDLREDVSRRGAVVDRAAEWARFIEACLASGTVPEEARGWKCPRTFTALTAREAANRVERRRQGVSVSLSLACSQRSVAVQQAAPRNVLSGLVRRVA